MLLRELFDISRRSADFSATPDSNFFTMLAWRLAILIVHGCGRQGDFIAMLEVKASNQGALSLYSKLGFDEVGRRPRYYSDGEDALLLQKQL